VDADLEEALRPALESTDVVYRVADREGS